MPYRGVNLVVGKGMVPKGGKERRKMLAECSLQVGNRCCPLSSGYSYSSAEATYNSTSGYVEIEKIKRNSFVLH